MKALHIPLHCPVKLALRMQPHNTAKGVRCAIKLYAQPVKISTGFHSCQDPTSFEYGISGLFEKYYGRRKQSDLTIISDLLYGKYSNKNVRN
jgi:hypothetical protein